MDSEITKIILEAIIGVVAILITGYLLPWFKSMVGEEKFALIVDCTAYAVRAAEQLFTPEQWREKKKYVLNGWEAASYGKVDAVKTSLFSPAN